MVPPHAHGTAHGGPTPGSLGDILWVISMVFGRGRAARWVAEIAALRPDDRVVDIGCGPGTAVRLASRRCATATGIEPSAGMRRMGRWLTFLSRRPNVTLLDGAAESIPLPDGAATVVWALSSVHHWADRAAGIGEVARVLEPGGQVVVAEPLTLPRAHTHASYGVSEMTSDELTDLLGAAGFTGLERFTRGSGPRTLQIVRGVRPLSAG